MRNAAIIVAAGRGTRAGGKIAKQWQMLCGRRVFDWSYDAFAQRDDIDLIVAVLHADDINEITLPANICKVIGGAKRGASVLAGLRALQDQNITHVLIHDAARACISQNVIDDVLHALKTAPAAAPGVEVVDALWRASPTGHVLEPQARSGLFRAQTPQGFAYDTILKAHLESDGTAADDVEIARKAGIDVQIVPGSDDNLKITRPEDFERAKRILRGTTGMRLGHGYDVHAFCAGDKITICGISMPFDRALKGHSDADVGLHALTDAIYGALAEGDIGQHFPPSDPQWRDADSAVFLQHAAERVRARGYQIASLDLTLICERPKIGPHAAPMRQRVADIVQMGIDRVSVKATTSEKLGFTGREEGIAAMATAFLVPL